MHASEREREYRQKSAGLRAVPVIHTAERNPG
jgi:hypothetical protein